jgi:hypothetical protein
MHKLETTDFFGLLYAREKADATGAASQSPRAYYLLDLFSATTMHAKESNTSTKD